MAADVLPPEVIRILSFHGPVTFWVGNEAAEARASLAVAPFEDAAFLFHSPRSPIDAALLDSTAARLEARAADGSYLLRMEGRASAGLPLSRHPRRGELEPWAPEGSKAAALVVATFIPDHIELVRTDKGEPSRAAGPTPAGKARPAARRVWARAMLGGAALPLALLDLVGIWIYLTLQGAEFPLRPLALLLAAAGGIGALAGARLILISLAFQRWRRGLLPPDEVPVLLEALLAPLQARAAGAWLLLLSAVLLLAVGLVWGPALAGLALGLSGVWALAPAWAAHLSMSQSRMR